MLQIEKARTLYRGGRDDLAGIIETLSDTLTVRGQRAFRRAVTNAASGDLTLGWEGATIRIEDLFSIYEDAFRIAGKTEANVIGSLDLDQTHPRITQYLRDRSATLVTDIDSATEDAIRRTISRANAQGLQPEEMVTRIRRVIGLTERDSVALSNFERGLQKQGLSPNIIERRVKEYRRRLLDARALVIARTEVTDAIETARQEAWEQAVRAGLVLRSAIWRTWHKRDNEACQVCTALDGAKARLGGEFDKGGHRAARPPAHPNCRCSVSYEADLRVLKHYGPGPHEGTRTPQTVHGNRGWNPLQDNPPDRIRERLEKLTEVQYLLMAEREWKRGRSHMVSTIGDLNGRRIGAGEPGPNSTYFAYEQRNAARAMMRQVDRSKPVDMWLHRGYKIRKGEQYEVGDIMNIEWVGFSESDHTARVFARSATDTEYLRRDGLQSVVVSVPPRTVRAYDLDHGVYEREHIVNGVMRVQEATFDPEIEHWTVILEPVG